MTSLLEVKNLIPIEETKNRHRDSVPDSTAGKQVQLDDGGGRRAAGRDALERHIWHGLEGRLLDMSDWCLFDETWHNGGIKHLPGRAHPGTEDGAVSGFLMVRVV